jgi:hypothetical protein
VNLQVFVFWYLFQHRAIFTFDFYREGKYKHTHHTMCIGLCIVVTNEEEEPTKCYLVFYYTYEGLNMFRAALCPSSGAHDHISDYHMDHLILRLLMVWRLAAGWLAKCPG